MTPNLTARLNRALRDTKREAGVIVPMPATIPVMAPSEEGFPNLAHALIIKVSAPVTLAVSSKHCPNKTL